MSDDDNDDLEVYHFQGENNNAKVPETVGELIVNPGVRVLPNGLCGNNRRLREVSLPNGLTRIGECAFCNCLSLMEIKICNTVEFIGKKASDNCRRLTRVEFENSQSSSPHQLRTLDKGAFRSCSSLARIKLTASVTSVGQSAFAICESLIEANLSKTCVTEIPFWTFTRCLSLQTVSLPNTLRKIFEGAFLECSELVTVVVPLLASQSITIGDSSFSCCEQLANLVLPQGSTAHDGSFGKRLFAKEGLLLHKCYGEDSSDIVAGLVGRFDGFPIHRLCYDHAGVTAQVLRECIAAQHEEDSLVDGFGMTPFHVLFSTADPSLELLDVLLESLPNYLRRKDENKKRPLDYLINNWNDETVRLFQRALEKWMIDRLLAGWGATTWAEAMRSKVQDLLDENNDKQQRETLYKEAYSALEYYENLEATSILEMALWKWKLKESGWTNNDDGNSKQQQQAQDREECRCVNGSDVVIPHVTMFLDIPRTS